MSKFRVPLSLQIAIGAAIGFGGSLSVAATGVSVPDMRSLFSGYASPDCTIKGNISMSGERIYHVPGQRYYAATRINPAYGERWFCSEEEARAAGWRKSKV